MHLKKLFAVGLAAISLAAVATAEAAVRVVSVSSPISRGDYASLTVSSSARCSIAVLYKSGPSVAKGLYPKQPARGRITWSWKVGTNTTPGRWPIVVACGRAGTLRTSFVVTY
jgi:hypothetical protein